MLEKHGDVAELYDQWSASYDADLNRTRDLAGSVLRGMQDTVAGREVLELGCGTGHNTAWLALHARRVCAVDFSGGMLAKARSRIASEHVQFLSHDLRSPLPLEDESWDVVIFALVLEHLESVETPIREAARVLRARGELVICEYHPFRQLAGGQARFRGRAGSPDEVRIPAHVHLVGEYAAPALAAGLTLVRLEEPRHAEDAPDAAPRLLSLSLRKA